MPGNIIVLKAIRQAESWYRQRGMLLFVGMLFPLIVVTLHTFGWIPWYGMDFTSLAFTVTGVLFSRSLFRFRLFDLVPIARTLLIDSLDDSMIVLDNQSRIVDLNITAERLLGRSRFELVGAEARQIFHPWEALTRDLRETLSTRTDIELEHQGQRYYYDLRISPIYDQEQQLAGRLIHLRDITEQKQVEIALRESEANYRTLFENLQDVFYRANLNGDIILASPSCEKVFGYTSEEALQLNLTRDLYARPEDRQQFLDRLAAQGVVEGYELRLKRKDGAIIWARVNSHLYRDQRGEIVGVEGMLSDISDRKQVEESLRESQRQLEASLQREQQRRQLSDTLREAVMIVSSTLEPRRVVGLLLDELRKVVTYHFASVMLVKGDQLTRLIRRSARGDAYRPLTFPVDAYPLNADVLAHKLPVLIPDTRLDPRWKSSSETGDVGSLINTPLLVQDQPVGVLFIGRTDEAAYTQEDVNILFAFATHVAIAVENARLAEQTRTALVDLQDTLERLQRTQQRLIESEKMAALGQLIAGVAHEINTPLGAIRASISNISAAMDTSLYELPALLRQLSSEQQDLFLALVQRAVQKRPPLTSIEERKLRRRIQGELESCKVSHADDLADTLVDIGVYDELEPFLPLFQTGENRKIVRAAYQLAIQRHNSDNILTAVDRVSKIAFALKSYGHYDHSDQKSQADIIEGLETVLTLYHNQLKHGVQVIKHYGDLPPVLCYPDELHQVWTNLIHNAIQAMEGRGTLEITVEPGAGPEPAHDSFVVVRITDSGHGIPEALIERIFEPFFTTKASGEGSGLGLDICRKIIEKHQGRIEVESQPGQTTFSVWLPNRNP